MTEWEEVSVAKSEGRHEIVLSGPLISKRIENSNNELDPHLFDLIRLNFLEVSRTCLLSISPDIIKLTNLTQLSLRSNKLSSLPPELGSLTKLKYLDASDNQLAVLPDDFFSGLLQLYSLSLDINFLSELPTVSKLTNLHNFSVAKNKIKALPDGVEKLDKLLQLDFSDNQIESISSIKWSALICLRQLNLSGNILLEIPVDMSLCSKLKDINLRANKLKDNRLRKLTDEGKPGAILEYLRKQAPKGGAKDKAGKKKGNSTSQSENITQGDALENADDEVPQLPIIRVIYHKAVTESENVIKVGELDKNYRPFIMGCIVKNINLNQVIAGKGDAKKAFIKFQDQLHRNECANRKKATIATHDNKKIRYPLLFTSKPGEEIEIAMLNSSKIESGQTLLNRLLKEAEEESKRKKRNKISGVYEYLHLLDNLTVYPVLQDKLSTVVSFPPITNCDMTKLTPQTTEILLEVSGSCFSTCKSLLDQLVLWLAEADISNAEDGSLSVEQVKVLEQDGQLKVVYPSKTDLVTSKFEIDR